MRISHPPKWGPATSHRWRLPSDVSTNAPFFVPTRPRTWLIALSLLPIFASTKTELWNRIHHHSAEEDLPRGKGSTTVQRVPYHHRRQRDHHYAGGPGDHVGPYPVLPIAHQPPLVHQNQHEDQHEGDQYPVGHLRDRKSTRLNSSHLVISYAVFCLK